MPEAKNERAIVIEEDEPRADRNQSCERTVVNDDDDDDDCDDAC